MSKMAEIIADVSSYFLTEEIPTVLFTTPHSVDRTLEFICDHVTVAFEGVEAHELLETMEGLAMYIATRD